MEVRKIPILPLIAIDIEAITHCAGVGTRVAIQCWWLGAVPWSYGRAHRRATAAGSDDKVTQSFWFSCGCDLDCRLGALRVSLADAAADCKAPSAPR